VASGIEYSAGDAAGTIINYSKSSCAFWLCRRGSESAETTKFKIITKEEYTLAGNHQLTNGFRRFFNSSSRNSAPEIDIRDSIINDTEIDFSTIQGSTQTVSHLYIEHILVGIQDHLCWIYLVSALQGLETPKLKELKRSFQLYRGLISASYCILSTLFRAKGTYNRYIYRALLTED